MLNRSWDSLLGCAAALGLLVLPSCAKRPYYSGFYFDSPTLVETDRSLMVRYLDYVLEGNRVKRLTMVTPEKGVQNIYPRDETSPGTTDWLPLPVLFAAQYVMQPKYRGLEIDLLAKTEADGYTPVTATHELDGSIRIEMGSPMRELVPVGDAMPGREELVRRYQIGPIVDGERQWQPLELYALAQTLALLNKEELAVLRGVPFIRNAHATAGIKGLSASKIAAQYHGVVKVVAGVLKETREIFLFDSPPDHDTTLFVGEPSKPLPIPCMSLLHEIGHAIADYARIRAPNQHDSPLVLAAFGAVRGSERGPTPYGRSDLSESFAESFAMAKADPAALRRIYPDLPSWFADGGHLSPLRPYLSEDPARSTPPSSQTADQTPKQAPGQTPEQTPVSISGAIPSP